MTTTDPIDGRDTRWLQLDESLSGLRTRTNELAQSQVRGEREQNALDQRLRELEGNAITLAADISAILRQLDELANLRERMGRVTAASDENREQIEAAIRQLRQEVDGQREMGNEHGRNLQALEKTANEFRERLGVSDESVRRINAEAGETAHKFSQMENAQAALGARITANADGLRRSASEQSAMETRLETLERNLQALTERVELSYSSLRRVEEMAEQWDGLRTDVDALRSRMEETLQAMDASKAIVSSVQRGFEAVDERIANLERATEQLRARDARRERAVSSLGDKIESVASEASQEQDRFITMQEQVRRRQIDELEQEIRELKSYLRVRSDE